MATYAARIIKVVTGGPFAYSLTKDGIGMKDSNGIATHALALNGVRDDIAVDIALIPGTNVISTGITVFTG